MCDLLCAFFFSISNGIPAARSPLTEVLEGRWCLSIGTSEWPVEEQNAQWFGSFPKKLFKNDMQQNQSRAPFPTFPHQRSWLLAQRSRSNRPIGSEIGWHLSHIYVPPTRYIVQWTSLIITSHPQLCCFRPIQHSWNFNMSNQKAPKLFGTNSCRHLSQMPKWWFIDKNDKKNIIWFHKSAQSYSIL